MAPEIQQIKLKQLHVASFHHRSDWSHLHELRDSIAARGVLCPLVVRKADKGYDVGAGVCRKRAAEMAGLESVPCIVVDLCDDDFIALQVDENRQRRGLHPMDEALYCEELHNRGYSHEQVAAKLGMKRRDVAVKMRLLGLTPAARKAFVDGAFDEESASSLATMGDAAKQADILAALEAGSLQAEEIVGYVRREFTASLEDVPWRMTDDYLVPKAGACSTCPKSSEAQKELFPTGNGLRCLDVDCWRGKMDATWQAELARPGVKLFEQPADGLFVLSSSGTRPTALRSSGMVDADAPCPHATSRTWREAVFSLVKDGDEGPTVYLARDQDGRPRFLMREAVATKMVKRSSPVQEAKAADNGSETSARDTPAKSSRGTARARREIVERFADLVLQDEYDTWAWVVERIIDGAPPRAIAAAAGTLERSIRDLDTPTAPEPKAGLLELANASNRQARRVATAVMIFTEWDGIGDTPESIKVLAADWQIDLERIEREVRKK